MTTMSPKIEVRIPVKEAARVAGVSEQHMRSLLLHEKIDGVKITKRCWVAYLDSVEEWKKTEQKTGRPRGWRQH